MGNCAFCGKKLGWTDFKGEVDGKVYCKEHYDEIIHTRQEKYSPSLIQGERELARIKYSGKLFGHKGNTEIVLTNFRAWAQGSDNLTTDVVYLRDVEDVVVTHVKSERDSVHTGAYVGLGRGGSYGGQSFGSSQQVGDITLMSRGLSALDIPDIRDPQGFRRLVLAVKKESKPSNDQWIELYRQEVRFVDLKRSLGHFPDFDYDGFKEYITKTIADLEREKDQEIKRKEEETKRFEESKRSLISIITDLLNAKIGDSIRLEAMKSDLEAGRTLTDEDSELLKKWTMVWGGLTTFEGKEQASIIESEKKKTPRKEDVFDELKKLAALRDSGVITNEEFESKKKELLSRI